MKVLVINCGSSSLKYQLIDSDTEELLAKGLCERIAVDGRLTHTTTGKEKYTKDLPMPDHNAAVSYVLEALTDKETGAITDYKIRRYGFHGTSHSFVSKRTAELLGKNIEDTKIIVCHLGNGSSITAVKGGKSVDTTMGLTPLAGVIMGTRSGDIDPAIIEFLANKTGKNIEEINTILNKKSGVYGLSGGFSDFRDLGKGMEEGNDRCRLALDVFAYGVKKYIGAYAAAMGGVDAIAFTAGIGENNPYVRNLAMSDMEYMGITIDQEANKVMGDEKLISTPDSKVKVFVVPTNEELAIGRETVALV